MPDNNFLPNAPDDQDRPYNYYAPLHDIFLRPKLPTLTGPIITFGVSCCMRAVPHGFVTNVATRYAVKYAYKGMKSSIMYAAGTCLMNVSRVATLWSMTQGLTPATVTSTIAGYCADFAGHMLRAAAKEAKPRLMHVAAIADAGLSALKTLAYPTACAATIWLGYTIIRHMVEPPPYDAPPGCYPSGGPIVEISQEEAPNREMVFTCPAPLARLVQERVLMCERDPTIIQKVKSIASRWCDGAGIQGNQRYAAICGAVAAALTVPVNEQLVLQLSQSHAVQCQYSRLSRYLSGIKHTHDAWWTKYFSLKR